MRCPRCRSPAKKLFQLPFHQGRQRRSELRERGQVECESCKTVLQVHVSIVYQVALGIVAVTVLAGSSMGVAIPVMAALALVGSWVEAKTTRYELLPGEPPPLPGARILGTGIKKPAP